MNCCGRMRSRMRRRDNKPVCAAADLGRKTAMKKIAFYDGWSFGHAGEEKRPVTLPHDAMLSGGRDASSPTAHGVLGEMTEDPIRQLKDQLIIQVALCGRAAIFGGVSPDGSYSLQDYYVRRIENMNTISALNDLSEEILQAFLQRSRQAKKSEGYPAAIRSVMEYINNHITEKISLKDLAAEVNYTEYYLSSKFKKEVGVSINTYIMKCKIDAAKELLGTGNYSICSVSDYLGFSSANYFGTVFKQHTGVTPTEFLAGGGKRAAGSNTEPQNP